MQKNIISAALILLATAILIFHGAYGMALLAMMTGAIPLIGRRVTGSYDARIPGMLGFIASSRSALVLTGIAVLLAAGAVAGLVGVGGWRLLPDALAATLVVVITWVWALKYVFMESLRSRA